MAAHRENIPVRQESRILKIDGGTMCRMPSPRPGPLRGASETDFSAFAGDFLEDWSRLRIFGSATEKSPTPLAVGNAA
jgi:hypothetical protein